MSKKKDPNKSLAVLDNKDNLPGIPVVASIDLNLKLTQADIIEMICDEVNGLIDSELKENKIKREELTKELTKVKNEINKKLNEPFDITIKVSSVEENWKNSTYNTKVYQIYIDTIKKIKQQLINQYKLIIRSENIPQEYTLVQVLLSNYELGYVANPNDYIHIYDHKRDLKLRAVKDKNFKSIVRLKMIKSISNRQITSENIVAVSKQIAIEVFQEI